MKIFIVFLTLTSLLFLSCKSKEGATIVNKNKQNKELTAEKETLMKAKRFKGVLKVQGITTYQYGTHTIKDKDTLYALRSDDVKLEDYVDKKVMVVVVKIAGYPIEGGPDYYKVLRIEEIKN